MAGVKGKSGGPRAGSGGARANSGGRRPGAGRPRKVASTRPTASSAQLLDAESYLRAVVEGREPADPVRVRAAATLIRYQAPQRRAPIENAAPRELQRRAQVADDRTVVEDFEKRAAEIRARHGRH